MGRVDAVITITEIRVNIQSVRILSAITTSTQSILLNVWSAVEEAHVPMAPVRVSPALQDLIVQELVVLTIVPTLSMSLMAIVPRPTLSTSASAMRPSREEGIIARRSSA